MRKREDLTFIYVFVVIVIAMSSNEITRDILSYLYDSGIFAWRSNSAGVPDHRSGGMRYGAKRGVADILAVVPPEGRLMAIEVKQGKDTLKPEQRGFLRTVEAMGGVGVVVRSKEEFVDIFLKRVYIMNSSRAQKGLPLS